MREFWSCSGWFIRPVVVSMLIFLSLFGVANLIQQNNRTYAANDLSITPATGYVGGGEPVTITLNQPLPYAKIIQTSAGREYSLGIDSNGQMYGWGQNGYGRIGTGNTTNLSVPTKIVNASNIQFKYVDATFDHSLGIDRDGNLYTWGENVVGKLGLGSINSNQYTPVKVTIAGDPKFILVDGGYDTSMALDDQGNVWTWGANNSYVLGHGDGQNKNVPTKVVNFSGPAPFFVTAVFSNDATELIFAIDTEGSIWGWGGNDGGSLGTGNTTTYPTPMKIYDAVTGNWFAGGAVSLPAGTKMAAVGASSVSGGAIDEHGNIYTWGSNNQRSMGSGSSAGGTGIPPLQIYTAATGDWLAAGSVDIGEERKMVKLEFSQGTGYAIDELGSVYTWGYNNAGQVGNNTTANLTNPVEVYNAETGVFIGGASLPAGTKITWAGGHHQHAFFLSEDGAIFAVGQGGNNKLGTGNTTNRHIATIISSGVNSSAFPITDFEIPEVFLGDAPCINVAWDSTGTIITCTTTAHAAGVVDVMVQTYSATRTLTDGFTYEWPPITITGISPDIGPTAGGTGFWAAYDSNGVVTITGSSFMVGSQLPQAASVTFDGAICTNINILSSTELTCVPPASPIDPLDDEYLEGVVDVVVDLDGSTDTLVDGYTYEALIRLSLASGSGMDSNGNHLVTFGVSPLDGVEADYLEATVKTNNPDGYKLSIKSNGSDLVCVDDSNAIFSSVAPLAPATETSLAAGEWGWNYANASGSPPIQPNTWRALPVNTPFDIANNPTPSATTGDPYIVWFGARANWAQPVCAYQQTLVITAVAN